MEEVLKQLAASIQDELRRKMQPLVENIVKESTEICIELCKAKLSEFQPDPDPVLTAVTKGVGPTPEEAAQASAKLLVSAALLSGLAREKAKPKSETPAVRAAKAGAKAAMKAAPKAKVPPKPKAEAKPAANPKPKAKDGPKEGPKEKPKGPKEKPKEPGEKPKEGSKEGKTETQSTGPPSVMSMIRKSLAPLQRSEPKKAEEVPIASVPKPKPKAPGRNSIAKSAPSPEQP